MKLGLESSSTCDKRGVALDWPRRSKPTNCRKKASTRSKQMNDSDSLGPSGITESGGPPGMRDRVADPGRHRGEGDPPANEQSKKSNRFGGLRPQPRQSTSDKS